MVLYWDNTLYLVSLLSFFVAFKPSSAVILVGELDGVRIISETLCELLQRVPDSTAAVFKLGSREPGAILFDAAQEFEEKDVSADEMMRSLQPDPNDNKQMVQAVQQCLNAAMQEFSPKEQRELLQAASFGKLWVESDAKLTIDDYDPNHFVDNCKTLRVLNACRQYDVGMPLTFEQFQFLEAETVIQRLVHRHNHFLALRISHYLRHDPQSVLVHWACAKIKQNSEMEDRALGQIIIDKLLSSPGLSFAKIATTAFHSGRRQLATMLLEHEPLATDQVPLLLSMKEDEVALNKAIESGDTDLVYMALLHIERHRNAGEFFELIRNKALARNLYVIYCRQRGYLTKLKTFYYNMEQPTEAANVAVIEAYRAGDFKTRMDGLKLALDFYVRDRSNPFQAQLTQDQINLLAEEAKDERAGGRNLVDLSVSELIERYIGEGKMERAVALKQKFNVPESRMWHLQVRTLAKKGMWTELYALVQRNNRKPPIGYQPFIEACVDKKAFDQAVKYIAFLPDPLEQMQWLCNIGRWREATNLAIKEKNTDALQTIRARCRDDGLIRDIDDVLPTL